MSEVLGKIYCLFESLFGVNLANHLWGFDGVDFTKPILFNTIGIVSFLISLVMVIGYYKVIDHPRFNRWWHWLIVLIMSGIINFIVGYAFCQTDLNKGNIADSLMFLRDVNGDATSLLINSMDCVGFGFANFIVSSVFFFILSMIFKCFAVSTKYSPF